MGDVRWRHRGASPRGSLRSRPPDCPKGGTLSLVRILLCLPGIFLVGSAAGLTLLARDAARGRPVRPGPDPLQARRGAPVIAVLGAAWLVLAIWLGGILG